MDYERSKRVVVWLALICVFALLMTATFTSPAFARGRYRRYDRRGRGRNALDDDARIRLNAAIHEMRKHGISPRINSAFRSRAEQQALYRCSHNRRCRARRGIYSANPPGTSMHEAGLAVDLGGIATGRRRLTPKGRQIVRIMRQYGFVWRYGLKDPPHFELSPRRAGYPTEKAVVRARQRRWLANNRARRRASKWA